MPRPEPCLRALHTPRIFPHSQGGPQPCSCPFLPQPSHSSPMRFCLPRERAPARKPTSAREPQIPPGSQRLPRIQHPPGKRPLPGVTHTAHRAGAPLLPFWPGMRGGVKRKSSQEPRVHTPGREPHLRPPPRSGTPRRAPVLCAGAWGRPRGVPLSGGPLMASRQGQACMLLDPGAGAGAGAGGRGLSAGAGVHCLRHTSLGTLARALWVSRNGKPLWPQGSPSGAQRGARRGVQGHDSAGGASGVHYQTGAQLRGGRGQAALGFRIHGGKWNSSGGYAGAGRSTRFGGTQGTFGSASATNGGTSPGHAIGSVFVFGEVTTCRRSLSRWGRRRKQWGASGDASPCFRWSAGAAKLLATTSRGVSRLFNALRTRP